MSPSLDAFGAPDRKIRIATKAIDGDEEFAFAQVKGELVLRHKVLAARGESGNGLLAAGMLMDRRR